MTADLLWIWFVIGANALLAIPVAYAATTKGRSGVGFFLLSFFFSFIVGILIVIAVPRVAPKPAQRSYSGNFKSTSEGELVKCPFCAEWVKSEAKVCKFCGKDIGDLIASLRKEDQDQEAAALAQREAKLAAYNAVRAEAAAKQAAQRAAFRRTSKFKLLVAGIMAVGLGIVGLIIFLSVQPQPQKPLVKSDYERVNEWLTAMDSCGFDIRDATIAENQEENSYSGEMADSIKYSPAEGAQHKMWSFKYTSWESMSELEIEMLISKKLAKNLVTCMAEEKFEIETLDLDEVWMESEDSEIFVNAGTKEIYLYEVQFLDW